LDIRHVEWQLIHRLVIRETRNIVETTFKNSKFEIKIFGGVPKKFLVFSNDSVLRSKSELI
jgi:hypothetical protein